MLASPIEMASHHYNRAAVQRTNAELLNALVNKYEYYKPPRHFGPWRLDLLQIFTGQVICHDANSTLVNWDVHASDMPAHHCACSLYTRRSLLPYTLCLKKGTPTLSIVSLTRCHAIAKMTARCAKYMSALKIVFKHKSSRRCARISTLQSYHYSAVKVFSKYSNKCDHGT